MAVPIPAPKEQVAAPTTPYAVLYMDRNVFFPGNTITGHVEVCNPTPMPVAITGIFIKFKGKETTELKNGKQGKSVFMRNIVTLAGSLRKQCRPGVAPQVLWLQPGARYSYPYHHALPLNLPATAEAIEFENKGSKIDGSKILQWAQRAYTATAVVVGTPDISDPADFAKKARISVHKVGFTLLSMIPRRQWEKGNPLPLDEEMHVVEEKDAGGGGGCCGGEEAVASSSNLTKVGIHIDKTIVAMDRDFVHVQFAIDNSKNKVATIRDIDVTVQAEYELNAVQPGEAQTTSSIGSGGRSKLYDQVGSQTVKCEVKPGAEDRVRAKIPIRNHTVPTQLGHAVSVTHAIHFEFVGLHNLGEASVKQDDKTMEKSSVAGSKTTPSFKVPMALAQGVDENDVAPIRDFNGAMYPDLKPGDFEEFVCSPSGGQSAPPAASPPHQPTQAAAPQANTQPHQTSPEPKPEKGGMFSSIKTGVASVGKKITGIFGSSSKDQKQEQQQQQPISVPVVPAPGSSSNTAPSAPSSSVFDLPHQNSAGGDSFAMSASLAQPGLVHSDSTTSTAFASLYAQPSIAATSAPINYENVLVVSAL